VSAPSSAIPEDTPGPDAVAALLRAQAPDLAGLHIRRSLASGSSNWVFRLGEDLAVRLPRTEDYAEDLLNEVHWLPHLAPRLPVPVPAIVVVGTPTGEFPRPWTVVSWVQGEPPGNLTLGQQERFARTLGHVLHTLHGLDPAEAPGGAAAGGYRRGEPVTDTIDAWADQAASALADLFDPSAVRTAWSRLREVPPPPAPPCLVHTDLSAENLLVDPVGQVSGVIDFGGFGVGDRSVDYLYAWSMFEAPARQVLREEGEVDDATWARARAWAFVGPGLLTIAHYRESMPARTARLIAMVEAVAAEVGVRLR
jgi:aminoglycoside phosphotransferase (APT) family kinase protein